MRTFCSKKIRPVSFIRRINSKYFVFSLQKGKIVCNLDRKFCVGTEVVDLIFESDMASNYSVHYQLKEGNPHMPWCCWTWHQRIWQWEGHRSLTPYASSCRFWWVYDT